MTDTGHDESLLGESESTGEPPTRAAAIYERISVDIQVGGRLLPCAPMCDAVFSGDGLSLMDLEFATRQLHAARTAGERPLFEKLELWPLPELFDHPHPVEVWSFLRSAEIGTEEFQDTEQGRLVASDGWRLGTDPGAAELLRLCAPRVGLRHVWFTLAGLERTHDELSRKPGAFQAIVAAMQRCREAELRTGATIIVSTRSAGEVKELAELLLSLGAQTFMPLMAFLQLAHGALRDDVHPQPEDLAGLPPPGLDVNWGFHDFWAEPQSFTECALTQAAMAEKSTDSKVPAWAAIRRCLWLWIAPDLDVLIRESRESVPRVRLANLRDDRPEVIYQRLSTIQWPPHPPSDAELAERFGDHESRKVYMSLDLLRLKWLARWKETSGLPWVPSGYDW